MKHSILLFLAFISFIGCQSSETQIEDQKVSEVEEADTLKAYNPLLPNPATGKIEEYLEWSSISINNKLPLNTTLKDLNTVLGKPDSVASINWAETCSSNFKSEDSKLAYYKGMEFELAGDSLYFQLNDFRKDPKVFLQIGNLRLDHTTTLNDIKKYFPNAVKNIDKMNVYGVEGEVESIVLSPSKELSEGHWLLMFQQGKLIRIEDWFPC